MKLLKQHNRMLRQVCPVVLSAVMLYACGGGNAPLDADTRVLIDSITTSQIGQARKELDSLCAVEERMQMAHLVDSIRIVRTREIEAQLKSVPR